MNLFKWLTAPLWLYERLWLLPRLLLWFSVRWKAITPALWLLTATCWAWTEQLCEWEPPLRWGDSITMATEKAAPLIPRIWNTVFLWRMGSKAVTSHSTPHWPNTDTDFKTCNISAFKILRFTRSFFVYSVTLFETIFKTREIFNVIHGNGAFHLVICYHGLWGNAR